MKKIISLVCIISVLAFSLIVSAADSAAAQHVAKKTSEAPVIDGNLNDAAWTSGFETCNPDSSTNHAAFQYKFVWNDNNLYFAAKFKDSTLFYNQSRIYAGEPNATASALAPWSYDTCEFYFSPNGTQLGDYHNGDAQLCIDYEPDGVPTIRVGAWPNNDQITNYKAGLYKTVAAMCSKTSDGWNLEVALPWSVLHVAKPDPTSALGIGVAQYDTDAQLEAGNGGPYLSVGGANWRSFADADILKLSNEAAVVATPSSTPSSTPTSKPSASTSKNSSVPAVSENSSSEPASNPNTGDGLSILPVALLGIASFGVAFYKVRKKNK